MGKIKYVKIRKIDFLKSIEVYRILSKSLQDENIIINQFNSLIPKQRLEIIKDYSERERLLNKQITSQDEDIYMTCLMVNLNIVATKYDIDSATVCMCISNFCKPNEKVLVL